MAPTVESLVTSIEVELEQANLRLERAVQTITGTLGAARADGRPTLTPEEDAEVRRQFQLRDEAETDVAGIKVKLEAARKVQRLEAETDLKLRQTAPAGQPAGDDQRGRPAYDQVARVGREERTYHPGNCRKGAEFIRDIIAQWSNRNAEAEHRLGRHMQEERVERGQYLQRANVGTANFSGLVVPQYLTDQYAPAVAALRPFADICNHHDLPSIGMSVNISRITTATSAAVQTEGNSASNTDIDDTLLTENVQTGAGYSDLTRQAVERGVGVEEVTMDDLFRRYATAVDATLLNQTTTGLQFTAQSTTWDDTTPTVPELWPKFLGSMANAEANFLGQAFPDYVLMHSRRWYWMQSYLGTSWPFINGSGLPAQAAGSSNTNGYNQGVRGVLPNGLRVVVDNNIVTNLGTGTNQDQVYVVSSSECHLWEDPNAPVFIRAEQPLAHQLAVRLVLYGYFAYSFRRYTNGQQVISGTGLVPPTF